MNTIDAPPTLRDLLEVQAGLLDARLEQSLGTRYAFAIYVVPVDLAGPVMAVSNVHAPLVEIGAEFCARQLQALKPGALIEVQRKPRVVQAHELPWSEGDASP